MAQDPIKIELDRLLLCEGKTTRLVLGPLCRHFEIQGFQPFDFGSKDNFGNFLEDIKVLPGFAGVKAIAVVRDAEDDANAAFASVRNSLLEANLPVPEKAGGIAPESPHVGVFLVPDNTSPGMIETLCMLSVGADPAFSCVEKFFACVSERATAHPTNLHKAHAQAFLATRPKVEYHVGRAADDGVWDFNHAAFAPLVQFLRQLND
jgi:hypothetical protein